MARSTPKAKPAKDKAPARKAASKSKPVARKAPKPKGAARKQAKRAKATKPEHDAKHEAHMAEVRQMVARRRPGMAPMVPHMHEQQDPSIVPPPPPPPAPADHLHVNWGDTKQKAVTRLDKPTNWFRQAPKAKSK